MALESPTWLNLCFVEKILRKSEGDNSIQVIGLSFKSARHDNYTSDMIRVTAEFWHNQAGCKIAEQKSIIDKMPLQGAQRDVDLAPLGFRMVDHPPGLDLAHSILAIHGIARFHAASVAICEKEPMQKEMYTTAVFNQNTPEEFRNFFIESIKALADEMAKWPEMKKYSEKIAKLADHIIKKGIEAFSEDEFNAINHGDCHLNNMLFKYDNDGKPTDHIFVDFQLCVYTSPAIDLLFFLDSSPSLDVIENKQDILLNEYLGTLSATMKQLNCKTQPLTMKELQAILKRRASYGMITFFTVLPVLLCCKSEATNLNDPLSTEFRYPGLKNEDYKNLVIKRLPLYDEWGLLDV